MDFVKSPSRCQIGMVGAAGSDHQPARGVPGRELEGLGPFSQNRPAGASESSSVTGLTLELEH
jgi:hypothetical protein